MLTAAQVIQYSEEAEKHLTIALPLCLVGAGDSNDDMDSNDNPTQMFFHDIPIGESSNPVGRQQPLSETPAHWSPMGRPQAQVHTDVQDHAFSLKQSLLWSAMLVLNLLAPFSGPMPPPCLGRRAPTATTLRASGKHPARPLASPSIVTMTFRTTLQFGPYVLYVIELLFGVEIVEAHRPPKIGEQHDWPPAWTLMTTTTTLST
jgi:hypothetical protein